MVSYTESLADYGGHPRTAVQIVLGTTALGILVIPLWLKAGMAWIPI